MNGEFQKGLSWDEYRYHAIVEMQRTSDALEEVSKRLDAIEHKQTVFDTRAKVVGSVYGFCAAALVEVGRIVAGTFTRH